MLFRIIPTGDLDIVNGDLVLIDGVDWFRQQLASRFKYFLGEWLMDRREGIPYYQNVFIANPDLAVIRSIFRRVVFSVLRPNGAPAAKSVPNFEVIYTPSTRSLAFNFTAVLDTGEIIVVTPNDAPFVIAVRKPS